MSAKRTLIFITGNKHKYQEVCAVLDKTNYEVVMQDIDLPEIQGTDDEIIINKAEYAKSVINGPFIVEDSGLEYEALNGLPGPYVKWFLQKVGNHGLVKMLSGYENKNARAVCNIAYYDGLNMHMFKGVVPGTIVNEAGSSKFGWDNIFKPVNHDQSYGEMSPEYKNMISHRRMAVDKLKAVLNN